jgi:hypothetical protein
MHVGERCTACCAVMVLVSENRAGVTTDKDSVTETEARTGNHIPGPCWKPKPLLPHTHRAGCFVLTASHAAETVVYSRGGTGTGIIGLSVAEIDALPLAVHSIPSFSCAGCTTIVIAATSIVVSAPWLGSDVLLCQSPALDYDRSAG